MSSRKHKVTENIENLCPVARKRSNTTRSGTTTSYSIAKIAHTESASSPVVANDLLEEMGIGMLDSEESSSSVVSAIALAVSAASTSDENSNEATPNLLAPKYTHQRTAANADTTLDTSSDQISTDVKNNMEIKPSVEKLQHKKVSIVADAVAGEAINSSNSSNSNSPNAVAKRTRNPLATVTCNSHANVQLQQSHQQQQPQLNLMPSTSKQALLLKPQQLMQPQHKQYKAQHVSPVPTESFFLYRTPLMTAHLAEGKNHFDKLSDEMVLHIFKWLPKKTLLRLGVVCKRFNCCSKDESLWTRLDLGGRTFNAGSLENVITRGVIVLRLAQTHIIEPAFSANFTNSHYDLRLQYLDLSLATISKQAIMSLLSHCRQLKKLSLEHAEINGEICAEIAKNRNLEALNLAMCQGLDAPSLRDMLESLDSLNSLNISWTYLPADAVTALVAHITPNIMRLNAAGCRKTMFDTHVATLAKRCTQLIELDLSDCSSLTNNVIGIICQFKMLEYLSVSRCYLIPASSYIELKNLKTLTYLDVFGMLSESAMALLEKSFPDMGINKFIHSSVARPTVGTRRTSIWGLRTRD